MTEFNSPHPDNLVSVRLASVVGSYTPQRGVIGGVREE